MNLPKISKPLILFIICIVISGCSSSSSDNTEQNEDLNILQNYELKIPEERVAVLIGTKGETKNLLVPVMTLTHNFDNPIVINDNEKISLLFFIFFAVIFKRSM